MNDLNQIYLSNHKPISNLFLNLDIITLREALEYVHELPYGRNFTAQIVYQYSMKDEERVVQNML